MTWNHRVFRTPQYIDSAGNADGYTYAVYEAYYNDNSEVIMRTFDPIIVYGETLEELVESYNLIKSAFQKPVLAAQAVDGEYQEVEPAPLTNET